MKNIVRFFKDEEGVTAIEYGLLAALIALAIAVGASAAWGSTSTRCFQCIATTVGAITPESYACGAGDHGPPVR